MKLKIGKTSLQTLYQTVTLPLPFYPLSSILFSHNAALPKKSNCYGIVPSLCHPHQFISICHVAPSPQPHYPTAICTCNCTIYVPRKATGVRFFGSWSYVHVARSRRDNVGASVGEVCSKLELFVRLISLSHVRCLREH